MTPPKDYIEVEIDEVVAETFNRVSEIRKKIDQIMIWCAGITIALVICIYKFL